MTSPRPHILLIGAGRFGAEHLREWMRLDAEGEVSLEGVVVRTPESAARVREVFAGPVKVGLQPHLLTGIDAVDIVTPSATHYQLVKVCLQHTHVLVEKPLTLDPDSATELGRVAEQRGKRLVVGHVYRFNPMVQALQQLVARDASGPRLVEGRFTNPYDSAVDRLDPRLEFLHLFDIIDLLFGVSPDFCLTVRRGHLDEVSLRYPGPINAVLQLGWEGKGRSRKLSFVFDDRRIDCDFDDNAIVVRRQDEMRRICFEGEQGALRTELRAFVRQLRGEQDTRVAGATTAARVVNVAVRKVPSTRSDRPRVAVVGGGVFGATCAIELAKLCDVTLFERHGELMTEASYLNQWRHHSGFHYPRSPLTVEEVKEARDEFVERYGSVVIRDFPSYYCTSSSGREITAERYLAICQANGLNFQPVPSPAEALAPGSVSLCLKTDEGVLDIPRLTRLIEAELAGFSSIRVRKNTAVVDGGFDADSRKRLVYDAGHGPREEVFDFFVNATYANRNIVAKWFQFPLRPLRFDLLELLVLELDIPRMSVTVLDGPFTSLVSMGDGNRFMLSHIHESVLQSIVTADGAPPQWGEIRSNRASLIRHAARYMPVVAGGRLVESRYSVRAVYAHSQDFDGRPTVVTDHGFGCWSVLGGKIITCVRNAREIAASIRHAIGVGDGEAVDSAMANEFERHRGIASSA